MNPTETFTLRPIGYVRRDDDRVELEILEAYRPGLLDLDHFTHVQVLWWISGNDNAEARANVSATPRYLGGRETGVFSTRSPFRPNPIGLTVCKILGIDHAAGRVHLQAIDALADTPVLDLKAYFPVADRVQDAQIPEWLTDWPEWFPDEGIDLKQH